MNRKFFEDLSLINNDPNQKKAFDSKGNTVVIAGPGSGKTRVLTLKAVKLCKTDIVAPSGLACISYSRETVRELKKDYQNIIINQKKAILSEQCMVLV